MSGITGQTCVTPHIEINVRKWRVIDKISNPSSWSIGRYVKNVCNAGWKVYIVYLASMVAAGHAREISSSVSLSNISWPSISEAKCSYNGTCVCDCMVQHKHPEWCAPSLPGNSTDAPRYAGFFDGTFEGMRDRTNWSSLTKIQKCATFFVEGMYRYQEEIRNKFGEFLGFNRFCAIGLGNAEERSMYLQGKNHGEEFAEEFCAAYSKVNDNEVGAKCENAGKGVALTYLENKE